jgi:pimeloyl-ACP methyl ester carboxylesterase
MPHATINGVELFYDERGSGEPILFHHGYTGSHDGFGQAIDLLQDRYRCIVMDARGAGDSAHPDDGYTIEQYASDVIGMADHLGLDRFTYAGHSMGGVIGMQLGVEHGDRLEKLILIAPAPASGIEETEMMQQMRERNRLLRRAKDRETLIRERTLTTARPNAEAIARGVDRALSVSDGHYEDSWTALKDARLADRLGEIQTPTLVIAGAADGLLLANLEDFQRLGNATLHVFSRVSHGIPTEAPEAFAEVIADFMEHGVVTAGELQAKLLDAITAKSGSVAAR